MCKHYQEALPASRTVVAARGASRVRSIHRRSIDPSTGRPAWTGLIGVTALGGSALEADTLSKMALLQGPDGARRVLAEHGGVIVHDTGEVEALGPIQDRIAAPSPLGPDAKTEQHVTFAHCCLAEAPAELGACGGLQALWRSSLEQAARCTPAMSSSSVRSRS